MVKLQDGRCVRRHQDHLRIRKTDASGQRPPVITVDKEPELAPLDDTSITIPDYIPTGSEDATPEPAVEAVEPSDSNTHSSEITADERTLS
jgi:hypothetical protein